MKHRLQIRHYARAMGTTVRKLPGGRRLIIRTGYYSVVIDHEGQELAVSSSDLMALKAVSEMSFPKHCCLAEWSGL
jgi:hypothetical protein